jgi:hypothetical protein
MTGYKYIVEDGYVCECESCGATAPLFFFDTVPLHPGRYLCEICASTFAGNMTQYPDQYDHSAVTLAQIVAHTGNLILDKIEGRTPPEEKEDD